MSRVSRIVLVLVCVAGLAACSAVETVRSGATSVVHNTVGGATGLVQAVFRDPRTQEEQGWNEILAYTSVHRVGADRLRIEASGGPMAGGGTVDLRLLVRASAETLTQGYSHFAIVHVRDQNSAITGRLFGTPIYGSETVWIGNYEQFVASRYERDYAIAPRAWIQPNVEAVVVMMNDSDRRARRSFDAREIYDSLIVVPDM